MERGISVSNSGTFWQSELKSSQLSGADNSPSATVFSHEDLADIGAVLRPTKGENKSHIGQPRSPLPLS